MKDLFGFSLSEGGALEPSVNPEGKDGKQWRRSLK